MKKVVRLLVAAAALATGRAWGETYAETVNGVTWTYIRMDGEARIYGGAYDTPAIPTETTGAIEIPATLGGYPVTSIGDHAFYRCRGLTSVTIPDSVTSIGDQAFYLCSSLTSVLIGNAVTSIGSRAFDECSGLTSVTMRGDAPSVGGSTFSGVASGCVVYLPKGNETYRLTDGKWQEMAVEWYERANVGVDAAKGTVEQTADGYVVTARDGQTLTEADFTFGAVAKEAYTVAIAADGKSATVTLNRPQVVANAGETPALPDPTGLLVEVDGGAALPVKTYKGLYYQAAWGGDLASLTEGEKVPGTGGTLNLGVTRQTGPQGFYRLSVSEK